MPHDVTAQDRGLPHVVATEPVEVPHADVTESNDDIGNSAKSRHIVQAFMERYREATKPQKGELLDEFVAQTGYHRSTRSGFSEPAWLLHDASSATKP